MKPSRLFAVLAALAIAEASAFAEGEEGKGLSFMPSPVVFSSPETGFGFGAILMAVGKLSPEPEQKQDSYRLMGLYTTKSQSAFSFQGEHFSPGNGLKLDAETNFTNAPSTFEGIGGPDGVEEDYTIRILDIHGSAGWKLGPELYLGPSLRWKGYTISDREAGGVLEGGGVEGAKGASYILAGPRLTWEGRDSTMAPTKGGYADLCVALSPNLAGTEPFSVSVVDIRGYCRPFDKLGVVVAGQALLSAAAGNPPFLELSNLGGDQRLRGYLSSRYVDKAAAFAQLELRAPIVWRLGIAAFCGAGAIGPSVGELKLADPHFAEGLGLRCLLDRKSGTNLRVDFAWGEGGMQTYFQFGEAF